MRIIPKQSPHIHESDMPTTKNPVGSDPLRLDLKAEEAKTHGPANAESRIVRNPSPTVSIGRVRLAGLFEYIEYSVLINPAAVNPTAVA